MPADDALELLHRRPPFLSLYLTTAPGTDDAHDQLRISWKNHRDALEAQGVPEDVLDGVEPVLDEVVAGATLAVVVDGDGHVHHRYLAEPPERDVASFGPLPMLAPLLHWAQPVLPHVIVVADRVGADITAVVDDRVETVEHVDGDTAVITKVAPGGWSQRRYQQRAENTWERNAAAVADEVAVVARSVGARAVIVAGDERAVGFLREHLPEDVARLLHLSDHGGRAPGAAEDELEAEVDRVVATLAADATLELLDRFAQRRGQANGAADGPGEVFDALRKALVDVLLIHDDLSDERTAWFDPTTSTSVATEPQTLQDLGLEPVEARLADVAIWSAVASGGTVRIVPAHGRSAPAEHIGALLRS